MTTKRKSTEKLRRTRDGTEHVIPTNADQPNDNPDPWNPPGVALGTAGVSPVARIPSPLPQQAGRLLDPAPDAARRRNRERLKRAGLKPEEIDLLLTEKSRRVVLFSQRAGKTSLYKNAELVKRAARIACLTPEEVRRLKIRICGVCLQLLPHDERHPFCPGARVEKIRRCLKEQQLDPARKTSLGEELRWWLRIRNAARKRMIARGSWPLSPSDAVTGTHCKYCGKRGYAMTGKDGWVCMTKMPCPHCRGTQRPGKTAEERTAEILGNIHCEKCEDGTARCWMLNGVL